MSESDIWVGLLESSDVTDILVIFFDIFGSKVVTVGILGVDVVSRKVVSSANNNIHSDLTVVINLFPASLNSIYKIGVPYSSSIHKSATVPIIMREDSWNES